VRRENDQLENAETQAIEQEQVDPNEAGRRRVMEFRDDELNCEHSAEVQAEETAVEHSARLMEQWDESDPVKNRYLLERVGREMMDVHEAPPPPIHPKEMSSGALGSNDDSAFHIELNKDLLDQQDPGEALNAYLHEYRHAEQHYEVLKSHGVGRASVDVVRAADLERNLDSQHYIPPPEDDQQPGAEQMQANYEAQLAETDSRGFADRITAEILERRDALGERGEEEMAVGSDADAIAQVRLAAERGGSA